MTDVTRCVVAIDGGASSTRAAIIDRSLTVISRGLGGPADHFSAEGGRERLDRSLCEATSPLIRELRSGSPIALQGVCLGLTGASIPGKRQAALETLAAAFPGVPLFIESDTVTAWAGAHAGQDGVVVIGGTGSVAYGRWDGVETLKGGFGYLLGDEGSGFRISLNAISAALHDSEGTGPATSLTPVVRAFFGVSSAREIPGKVYAEDIAVERIAALCPLVMEEARRRDREAVRIVEEAGRDLGGLAVAALRALGDGADKVSYTGGVFGAGELILAPFRECVLREVPRATVSPPAYSPLVGAGIVVWNHLSGRSPVR